jgi:NDP-sugar pyrophosphorylase family protein
MQAVILTGGLGLRLRPLTQAIPKPLLPIGEKSLLEIQIGQLKRHGFDEIYLANNYKSEYIKNFLGDGSRYGVRVEISLEDKPLGTVGPLTLLRDKLREPFILMNGDILSTIDFTRLHRFALSRDADLCVAIKKIVTPYDFGRIDSEGDYVTGIEEKPDIELEVVAGIYLIKPELLPLIPEDTYYCMDELMREMLRKGLPISKYAMKEYWLDIGQIPDYEQAQNDYETHFGANDE